MPAHIDSMMYVGDMPWHKQGIMVDESPTIEDAIEHAGLNWEVNKAPTYYTVPGKHMWQSHRRDTGHYVTYRTDTNKPLGNVSERYAILQNRDAFKPFQPMIDMGFTLETAGAVEGGKRVWILAKSPDKFLVGDDKVDRYVFIFTSHDGSLGNCFRDTGIRIVCANTLDYALDEKGTFNYQLKHTSSIKARIIDLRDNIKKSDGNFARAITNMNRFNDFEMDETMLDHYLETVIPFLQNRFKESIPEKNIFVRNTAKPVYERLVELYHNGTGNKGKSLWDAYNAVTEYYTHDKQYKDWVKSTQFGKPYDYKVNAYNIAVKFCESRSKTNYSLQQPTASA